MKKLKIVVDSFKNETDQAYRGSETKVCRVSLAFRVFDSNRQKVVAGIMKQVQKALTL